MASDVLAPAPFVELAAPTFEAATPFDFALRLRCVEAAACWEDRLDLPRAGVLRRAEAETGVF